jgi:Mlc titration factor MtfA (ptsG expression regulator)
MNEQGSRPSWKQPFLRALRESDKQRLRELVIAAEHAIILRQQELGNSSHYHEERSEMQVTIAALLTVSVYKLGSRSFPDSHSARSTLA